MQYKWLERHGIKISRIESFSGPLGIRLLMNYNKISLIIQSYSLNRNLLSNFTNTKMIIS